MRTRTVCWIASLVLVGTSVSNCAPRSAAVGPTTRVATGKSAAPLASAPDQFFTDGDVRLRYRETGRGQPVVLLHGLTRSLDDWAGVGDSIALDYHVIAVDERGFGQSTRFTDPARFGRAMADDVVRLMDHLQIQRAHLVGHSMGAVVAANVAIRYPARVASVSLVAPPSFPDSAAFAQANAGWVMDLEAGKGMGRMLQWLFPYWPDGNAAGVSDAALTTNPPVTLAAVLRSMAALMVTDAQVSTARVPMLAAVGTHDPLLVQTRWIASRWPGARLLEIPGADHGVVVGDPAVLAAIRHILSTRTTSANVGNAPFGAGHVPWFGEVTPNGR